MRRRLPEARLPFEAPGMGAALAASALISTVARRSKLPVVAAEALSVSMSLVPALMAIRGSQVAGYHGAEHKAIGGYEQDTDAIDVTKEHERCGSHMVGPMLIATAAAAPWSPACPRRVGPGTDADRPRRHRHRHRDLLVDDQAPREPGHAPLGRPGYELQRVAATREPTDEELEVAKTALNEVLRLEGADPR